MLEMRTFQFQMPPFLIETCLTLRFTFSEVGPKIGPNSVPELSINLIEALSTDKLRLIVSSWISLLKGLGSILEKMVNPKTYTHWNYAHPKQLM